MASSRRRALRRLGNYVNRLDRRVKRLSRRPAPRRIAERSVTTEVIDVDAVTTVELAPDSVTTEIIAPGAVDTDNIADGAIDIDKIDGATQDELGGIDSTRSGTAPSNPQEGDFWIDTSDNNNLKRYDGTTWVSVRDLTIATAQSAANAAQTTANGKNRVFRQTSAPTASAVGDIWFDTDDDNRIYRWDGSTWVANNLGNNAIQSLSANKITAGTIDASVITVSNINAGNISTGTLNAARIAAGSLDASKITAGTITATQISSSYVYAGTISAGNITAGTLSASVALTAESGTIAGWQITSSQIQTAGTYSGHPIARFAANGAFVVYQFDASRPGSFVVDPDNGTLMNAVSLRSQSTGGSQSNWYPYFNNNVACGLPSFRWTTIFLVSNPNVSSDSRLKDEIAPVGLGLDFVNALRPVQYVMKDTGYSPVVDENGIYVQDEETGMNKQQKNPPDAKVKYGLIAQEVVTAVESFGVDKHTFGPWSLDDENDQDSMQGLSYEQFVPILIKAVQELSSRLAALEQN